MLWGQFVPTVMFPCLRAEKKGEEKGSDGRPLGSTHEAEGQEKCSPAASVKGGWRQEQDAVEGELISAFQPF